jgi:hypothetical protein
MSGKLTLVIGTEDADVIRDALNSLIASTMDPAGSELDRVRIADQIVQGIGEAERGDIETNSYVKSSKHWISPRCGPA